MSATRQPAFPETVAGDGHSATIYHLKAHNGRAQRFVVAYYSGTKRVRVSFPTVDVARTEARRICELLAAGDAEGAALTGKDRAELVHARAALKRHGVGVQVACEAFAEAADAVGVNGVVRAAVAASRRKRAASSR